MSHRHEITRTLQRPDDLFQQLKGKTVLQANIELPAVSRNVSDSPTPTPNRREKAWLESRLVRGSHERFSEFVKVTPGLAAEMLKHNMGNRRITRRQVDLHVDRLARGDFKLTHHGISFAKTRVLNDGQHRLTAIVESGVTAEMQITFGAERDEFTVIDQGRPRTAGNFLAINGMTYSSLRASIAKALYNLENKRSGSVDQQIVADYAMSLSGPDMDAALRIADRFKRVTAPTIAGVAYYWINKHSRHSRRLDEFFAGLNSGDGLTAPRLKLREWLRNGETDRDSLLHNMRRIAAFINCWNSWLAGRKTFSTDWTHVSSLPDVQ